MGGWYIELVIKCFLIQLMYSSKLVIKVNLTTSYKQGFFFPEMRGDIYLMFSNGLGQSLKFSTCHAACRYSPTFHKVPSICYLDSVKFATQ